MWNKNFAHVAQLAEQMSVYVNFSRKNYSSWRMKKGQNNVKISVILIIFINLILLIFISTTAGWHYIRGYNEVGNSLAIIVIVFQAILNMLMGGICLLIYWFSKSKNRKIRHAFLLGKIFLISTVLLALSPLATPLIGNIAKKNLWINTPIAQAARYGDFTLVEILLEKGRDPNAKDTLGRRPLHYICHHNNQDTSLHVTRLLIQKGVNLNPKTNTSHETPLHWAVNYTFYYNNIDLIKLLLESGADPNLEDWEGNTPFDNAIDNFGQNRDRYKNVIKLLLEYGANTSQRDENGKTPLEKILHKWGTFHTKEVIELFSSRSNAQPSAANTNE